MDSLNRVDFFDKLRARLNELGVDEDNINKYIRQFERYFNTMTDDEATEQIQSFNGVDGIANNICTLIKKKEEADRRSRQPATEDDTPTVTYKAVKGEGGEKSISPDDRDTRVIESVKTLKSGQNKATKSDTAEFSAQMIDDDNQGSEIVTDESDDDYDPLDSDEADVDDADEETDKNEAADDDTRVAVHRRQPEQYRIKRVPAKTVSEIKKTEIRQPKIDTRQKFSEISRQNASVSRQPSQRFDETAVPQINFNELDDGGGYEEKIPNSVLYWVLFIITLPITAPLIIAVVLIFAAVFAALAVSIVGLVIALIGVIIAGTALSLTGIIYGITVTFNTLPVGLFEIGLGIVIGGAAMLVGILIYNFAVRFLPFVIRCLSIFFGFVMRKIKELFNFVKMECAKTQ